MKCFYHSADLDGHCSGAVVKYFQPECEMIGINYGQAFPWDKIQQNETVFMVDFTLQPFDDMWRLLDRCGCGLVWIDHHKTEIETAEADGFAPGGIRRIGTGACALVWEWFDRYDMPEAVRLLAAYDVWDHSDPRTLPFQYGIRFEENTWPDNHELWGRLLQPVGPAECVPDYTIEIEETGRLLLEYERRQNAKFCRAYAFETGLTVFGPDGREEYRAIAANRGFTNSKLFDAAYDPARHDLMITFCRLKPPAGKWTVSLYSDKPEVDCGDIARLFGGGGHKGAAGFQADTLPFAH